MTEGELKKLEVVRKDGSERFHTDGSPTDFDLLDFWQWSASDFIGNTARGVLAEYIVARAVHARVEAAVRDPWAAYDIETPVGIKVEVKSSGYVQNWAQDRHSSIQFNIPRTHEWDPNSGQYIGEAKRHADLYIFAVLAHKDQSTIDPMNLAQWEFYVISTAELDERIGSQKSIRLGRIKSLASPISFRELEVLVRSKATDG